LTVVDFFLDGPTLLAEISAGRLSFLVSTGFGGSTVVG
jgi:hypothetical protein